jgi:hypothetical protein
LVGVAVNVTDVPEQIEDAEADTATAGVRVELTVIVTEFEVAGLPEIQVPFEVMIQVTVFPLAKAAFEYVGLLVPTLDPLTCH